MILAPKTPPSGRAKKLFQILNYRYINRLPLVVTTNLLLEEIEERIRSRLEDPDLVTRVICALPIIANPPTRSAAKIFIPGFAA